MTDYVVRAATVLQGRMETNDERRKRRLKQLCDLHGGVRAIADHSGVNWATLDQILKGALLPERADGTRNPRSLGDENARTIEEAYGLGRGWFDWPFDLVDFGAYDALDPLEQGAAQAKMMDAIREFAEKRAKAVLRKLGAKKEAMSDEEVEQHLPGRPSSFTKPAIVARKSKKSA